MCEEGVGPLVCLTPGRPGNGCAVDVSVPAAVMAINDVVPEVDAVWRLLAAAALGSLVGIEREADDQPAGLRTHITVCLGSALFGVISTLGFTEFVDTQATNVRIDVTRVASQVVVGMGFLGAGIIFRSGSKIRNLTTAASLWTTAAIGLAAGVGDLGIASVGAGVLIVALLLLRVPRNAIRDRLTHVRAAVSIGICDADNATEVLDAVESIDGISIVRLGWSKADGSVTAEVLVEGEPGVRPEQQFLAIAQRDDVADVRFGPPSSD